MSEEDAHLLDALAKGRPKRIAVSVLPRYENPKEKYAQIQAKFEDRLGADFELTLFDAESSGCWIHP